MAPGVNKPILCGEAVVEGVQLRLRLPDGIIRNKAVHLLRYELLHAVPQLHHALGTLLCGGVEVGLGHDAVLTVVQLPVHHGVGEVPHIRVCRDGLHDGLILAQIGQLRFRVGSTDIPNCAAGAAPARSAPSMAATVKSCLPYCVLSEVCRPSTISGWSMKY